MIKPVKPFLDFPRMEESILRYWQMHHVVEKSTKPSETGLDFVFYEAPQIVAGEPELAEILGMTLKDIILRYKVMRGHHIIRRAGWNTQGLSIEVEMERQLDLAHKINTEEFGIGPFNEYSRRTVITYLQDWVRIIDRAAFWVNLEDAYVTQTPEFIESVWWAFKTLWDKGLIARKRNVVSYCSRCGTPLSDLETEKGTVKIKNSVIYVRLPLVEDPGTSLLISTSAPWTLIANVAVAANPDLEYVIIERKLDETTTTADANSERLIISKDFATRLMAEESVKIYEHFKGHKLRDLRYKPLFTYLHPDKPAFDVVTTKILPDLIETGLEPISPFNDPVALQIAQSLDLPVLESLESSGIFLPQIGPWRGQFPPNANPGIIADLDRRGLLFRMDAQEKAMSYCVYCTTPLIQMIRDEWHINLSQHLTLLKSQSQQIEWLQDESEAEFNRYLNMQSDWLISRNRFWGTPLPIWECDTCQEQLIIGSTQELAKFTGPESLPRGLHRPEIDQVIFPCPKCGHDQGGKMNRTEETLDNDFDIGSTPFAQWHIPFENQMRFEEQFPADLVVSQNINWFYAMHVINNMMFEKNAFRRTLAQRNIEIIDYTSLKLKDWIESTGIDALRWAIALSNQTDGRIRFSQDLPIQAQKNLLVPLWEILVFFTAHAHAAAWAPGNATQMLALLRKAKYTALDRWVLSELHSLIKQITESFDQFDISESSQSILHFITQVHDWYLSQVASRFRQPLSDSSTQAAYATLYEILVTISKLASPIIPFIAEEIYLTLVHRLDEKTVESVHLTSWPNPDMTQIDLNLNKEMHFIRKLADLGIRGRREAAIQDSQPLSSIIFIVNDQSEVDTVHKYSELLSNALSIETIKAAVTAEEKLEFILQPDAERLNAKYGEQLTEIRDALILLEPEITARQLFDGEPVQITINGKPIWILPEDVEVMLKTQTDYSVTYSGARMAILEIKLSPRLLQSRLVNEFIRIVNIMREQAEFGVTEKIKIVYEASTQTRSAIQSFRGTIIEKTYAISLENGMPEADMYILQAEVDGDTITVGITTDIQ